MATAVIGWLAGADPVRALALGASMTALQSSIGALNDLVDAPTDAGHKPGKPIPAGSVGADAARVVAVLAAATGMAVAVTFGAGLVALAGLILSIGYAYDLVAKGTAWSWLPFAVGIPLLPVYAWFGATGTLPASFLVLLPAGVAAGAALSIANARVDLRRDLAAGLGSVAGRLGDERSWVAGVVLLLAVIGLALVSLWVAGAGLPAIAGAGAASVVVVSGLAWAGPHDPSPARRERAWQVQAVGVALLAAAWLAGIGPVG